MVDTIRTQQFLLDNVFQDGQAPGSITPQDMRDFVVTAPYMNHHGWQFYYDDLYTQLAPRTVTGGARVQVTINGGFDTLGHPPGTVAFWNTTTNKLIPNGLNNFGIIRLAFTGFSDSAPSNIIELELDAGGTAGIIWNETAVFLKGAANAQSFNFIIPLFSGPDFQANGGTFYITPTSNASFWQFALTAVQVYSANPTL